MAEYKKHEEVVKLLREAMQKTGIVLKAAEGEGEGKSAVTFVYVCTFVCFCLLLCIS